ncbi:chemotaxis protein CheW [Gilvimarinus agarilyticus]|uniref:chemotaxis protein CheW n=1 Tax=unclassified Gilvimarinus TaxID=2642066 RepID=UPI001C085060|nr:MULTISPECIES: chemotaxis protein CheW [unclassified Gilvimarinus]MBU2884431.1 chemotaxis protein CheW [Gilvimarinus agarilyticus]MDO6569567.1 chemotaxis protein CheW [Gilvimarinus sp. 2_MG-2023]MDO6748108.1 chemotaxis protein CheW [Gilvimarinus sp. 1_MG-2023]
MAEASSAFHALAQLANQSRQAAQGLPAQIDAREQWSGIGFSLLGSYFIASMDEVSEMLEVPHYTHLPGVQPWVRGVANVRGRLLPLFDLAAFCGGRLVGGRKRRRVLVLETETLYSGLIVDQVFGMQHFPVDEFQQKSGDIVDPIRPYVQGSYIGEQQQWNVFLLSELAQDQRFISAARD